MTDAVLTRQPTLEEAVHCMKITITQEQKIANLKYWKAKYGEEFARQVHDRYQAGKKASKKKGVV